MELTKEERLAIAALKRLAARWPKSLRLIHSSSRGSILTIVRRDESKDAIDLEGIETIRGFNPESTA